MHPWKTVVALGDSFTEGVGEPFDGLALRSSIDHLALVMRHSCPELSYTNLAKRGLKVREVREQQLVAALALSPDFVSVIAGANDVLKQQWQANRYEHEMRTMLEAFQNAGTTIFTASWPDWTKRLSLPEAHRIHLRAQLEEGNAVTTELADEFGAIFLDVWDTLISDDPIYWSADQIHPNASGYLAYARLAIEAIEHKTGYVLGEPASR